MAELRIEIPGGNASQCEITLITFVMSYCRVLLDSTGFLYESRLTRKSHGSTGHLKLIQKAKSVKKWFKKLIAHLTGRQTALVLLELSFDSEAQAASLDGIPKIPKTDDLDRRLTEAWIKSVQKPEPSRRERIIRRASGLEAKRNAPQPLAPLTCCPACGSDKYQFEVGIDFHVCLNCGKMFL